jgi:hypothetical protein
MQIVTFQARRGMSDAGIVTCTPDVHPICVQARGGWACVGPADRASDAAMLATTPSMGAR